MFHLEAAGGESRDLLTVHVEFVPRQDEHHSYLCSGRSHWLYLSDLELLIPEHGTRPALFLVTLQAVS